MPAEPHTRLPWLRERLIDGLVIPAHPLALNLDRRLDERRQRALTRYYLAAGAGGLAVAVHTTQFLIRDPMVGLFMAVLEMAAETAREAPERPVLIAGVCGKTRQALREAGAAAELGYDAGLLSLAALPRASDDMLIAHCREVARALPLVGFYLQPAVGGRPLSLAFWRRFVEIEEVVAVKVAPFDRYRTLDVARAIAESGRAGEIALYTGNDDSIVADLLMHWTLPEGEVGCAGGLLGQWAVGTRRAVELLARVRAARDAGCAPRSLLDLAAQITDTNAALFDAANGFAGCLCGIHEVLHRQGLMQGRWCIDPAENVSFGQVDEIDRVLAAYPHLHDDAFVEEHIDQWLA